MSGAEGLWEEVSVEGRVTVSSVNGGVRYYMPVVFIMEESGTCDYGWFWTKVWHTSCVECGGMWNVINAMKLKKKKIWFKISWWKINIFWVVLKKVCPWVWHANSAKCGGRCDQYEVWKGDWHVSIAECAPIGWYWWSVKSWVCRNLWYVSSVECTRKCVLSVTCEQFEEWWKVWP